MKRLRLLALALFLVGVWLIVTAPAESKHERWLPGIPTTVMNRAIDRGYVIYRFEANAAAYPDFKAQALQVASAGFISIGIGAVEVTDGTPDIWLTMPDDATFISACGQGAAGCIQYWADPVMIFFRRALLYSDWKTTIAHEGLNYGHAMGEHEQYFDLNDFRCDLTAFYTVMSCGTGVWQPTRFDIDTVHAFTLPRALPDVGVGQHADGTRYVYYCGGDTLRARRVALMLLDWPGGDPTDDVYYWSGIHMPLTAGCQGWNVEMPQGRCYFLAAENGFNFLRADLRNDRLAGCT